MGQKHSVMSIVELAIKYRIHYIIFNCQQLKNWSVSKDAFTMIPLINFFVSPFIHIYLTIFSILTNSKRKKFTSKNLKGFSETKVEFSQKKGWHFWRTTPHIGNNCHKIPKGQTYKSQTLSIAILLNLDWGNLPFLLGNFELKKQI